MFQDAFATRPLFDLPSKTCLEELTELAELTEQVPVSFPFQMPVQRFHHNFETVAGFEVVPFFCFSTRRRGV